MKYIIDLDLIDVEFIRLVRGIEYTLLGTSNIILSTLEDSLKPTHKAYQNGTPEVLFSPTIEDEGIPLWLFYEDSVYKIDVIYNEFVLAEHQDDITPAFINEDYPLFKKFVNYYFKYLGMEFNPSGFIHSLEKFADIDQTFGEFKNQIFSEVLTQLPNDTKASKEILSKYILDFYSKRGTEQSIEFLIRILFNEDVLIDRRRDSILIASDKSQGRLSNSSIILQGNYLNQLHSYVLKLKGIDFWEYETPLKTLVNPSGYLPFGENLRNPIEVILDPGTLVIG